MEFHQHFSFLLLCNMSYCVLQHGQDITWMNPQLLKYLQPKAKAGRSFLGLVKYDHCWRQRQEGKSNLEKLFSKTERERKNDRQYQTHYPLLIPPEFQLWNSYLEAWILDS